MGNAYHVTQLGSQIEAVFCFISGMGWPFILLAWTVARRLIVILSSVSLIALICHNAVPRTERWHSVLPGAILATAMWFAATLLFGWYLNRYADYNGSLVRGRHRLAHLDVFSLFVVLVDAEFNAMLFRTIARAPAPSGIHHP